MKLKPVITEKSMSEAKEGRYTFLVSPKLTKHQIKKLVEDSFAVNVTNVWTILKKGSKKKTIRGRIRTIKPAKKAIVALKEKQKIDIFEVKK